MKIQVMNYGSPLFRINEAVHPRDFTGHFHRHPFFEVGLIIGGSGRYEVVTDETAGTFTAHPVKRNMLVFWDGAVAHRAVDTPGDELYQIIIVFDDSYTVGFSLMKAFADMVRRKRFLCIDDASTVFRCQNIARRMLRIQSQQMPTAPDMLRALTTELLCELYAANEPAKAFAASDARIRTALEEIHAHYSERLSPAHYADHFFISTKRFSDLFRKETGKTFVEYVNDHRIGVIKDMLARTDKNISTIAFETGFNNLSHFNRLFRRVEGVSPVIYRKRNAAVQQAHDEGR
ncbi:MAG: AraC family transcriptional regulator [Spirochaetota bacterium]